jgi:hypothetical protein
MALTVLREIEPIVVALSDDSATSTLTCAMVAGSSSTLPGAAAEGKSARLKARYVSHASCIGSCQASDLTLPPLDE